MKFSLILATVGRIVELECFLSSLEQQTYRNFELIIVDQNSDDRLFPIVKKYRSKSLIKHLRSEPGVSRARNIGLEHASGDIVAFPDDDCWYSAGLLAQVANLLAQRPDIAGVTGRVADAADQAAAGRYDSHAGELTPSNVWRRAVSISIFLRSDAAQRIGPFDQELGAGAGTPYGSGEETDYLLRALRAGLKLHYDPELVVGHPNPTPVYDGRAYRRACSYGMGTGRVLQMHRYGLWQVAYTILRPLGGAFLAMLQGKAGKARFHWLVARGRAAGWWIKT